MKVLLVNASAPSYNLGLEKAANWWRAQGAAVEFAREVPPLFLENYEAVWISALFSWHVPALVSMAQQALDAGKRVEVGGPGTFGAREHIRREMRQPTRGLR